jgi:fatty-acyl-CoA synthase
MLGTMQDIPLGVSTILRHGQAVFGDSEVTTFEGERSRSASFETVASRAERLASALGRLGVGDGDRVGTFCWNHEEHLEAYLGVPSMGAVLHTLNIRLFPDQLAYVVNHAGDKVLIADRSLGGLIGPLASQLGSVEHVVATGAGDTAPLEEAFGAGRVVDYEDALQAEEDGYGWPELDERSAAAMCYTTGTTGNPKGVVYSHRSTFLHSLAVTSAATLGLNQADRILVVVPMFHANAWGTPYAAWMVGSDLVMPQRFLQAEPLARMMSQQRPTVALGVPTIWNDLLSYGETAELDLSSLRCVVAGGAAVPRSLIEAYHERYGVWMLQGWGMTETSPLCALSIPPRGAAGSAEVDYRSMTGRVVPGVELRVVDAEGHVLERDGSSLGEFEVRGPWVTASYYRDPSPERFHDGWLRTGDVGHLDKRGYMQLTDRTKDVIKSGGEWISSVELENLIMAHPEVREAAVIGVPDPRWDERPLACIVRREGGKVGPAELREFLSTQLSRWALPERWAFLEEIPKTSVGKFDKKALRARHSSGNLPVELHEQGG